ncbi:MAG: putative Ntn-hydrolase superfamily protein, partial [Saprospiraceae bacterium]
MIMYKKLLSFIAALLIVFASIAQDTFSIVAVDSVTGEVGSAGASCVALANFGLPPDFLGVLFPGVGAINSQAYYLSQNQNNATARMNAGDAPQEIIDWLVANDIQGNPTLRQYGVVRLVDNEPFSAAHTGANTDDYKGHRTGPTYSIQGNILLGPQILDSMEYNFLNTEGDLAHKLMAAMQGANVVGADTRCAGNGTSSLFSFLKVAGLNDDFGNPSLVLGVDFPNNSSKEPIDSLQILFNQVFPPVGTHELLDIKTQVYPNPAQEEVVLE